MNTPLLSVIVPAYNREKTIRKCLEGILAVKDDGMEVIAVDDGSTDLTLQVLHGFEKTDSRVKVIHKTNGGVSSARNAGLEIANGEWILFVDSDDTVFADTKDLVSEAQKHNADLVMFGRKAASENELAERRSLDFESTARILNGNPEIINYIFGEFGPEKNEYYLVHTKLFRNSVIQKYKIRFDENVSLGEDQIFVCEYLKFVQALYFVPAVFSAELVWKNSERDGGLGSMLRPPENFLENQIANYRALCSLYEFCGQEIVDSYALHYISDRPISRILMRYSYFRNRKLYPYRKLKAFFYRNVSPLFRSLNLAGGGYMYRCIKEERFFSAYIAAVFIYSARRLVRLAKSGVHFVFRTVFRGRLRRA